MHRIPTEARRDGCSLWMSGRRPSTEKSRRAVGARARRRSQGKAFGDGLHPLWTALS